MKKVTHIALLISFALLQNSFGGSAIWDTDPASDDWNTAANWTPDTVPNGIGDVATFGFSNSTDVTVEDDIELDSIVFNPEASAFNIIVGDGSGVSGARVLTLSGAGIVNNSAATQNFVNLSPDYYQGAMIFTNSATAGANNVFTNTGDDDFTGGGFIEFHDAAGAGMSTFINEGGNIDYHESQGGRIEFYDDSSADNATITNERGLYYGASLSFYGHSTARNAYIVNEGGDSIGWAYTAFSEKATAGDSTIVVGGGANYGIGAFVEFSYNSTAGKATLIAKGGSGSGRGGIIYFDGDSHGDDARVQLSGNGTLDISLHRVPGVRVGSIEGEGLVHLGQRNLFVGANHLSTKFHGVISQQGSLTKVGRGQLVLTNANTYAGGTTISRGALVVSNTTGSATGSGPVTVEGRGTLAGTGIVAGPVTLGTGGEPDAVLSPGESVGTLTLRRTLTFMAEGVYDFEVSSGKVTSDQVAANGVTIDSSAYLSASDIATESLSPGTVFNVISNTSSEPIAGVFSNLADGSTIVIGKNGYQANYEGGDGNDLTLTVISN